MKMNRKFVGILVCIVLGVSLFSFLSGIQVGRSEFAGVGDSIPKGNEISFPFSYLIDTNSTHYFLGNGTTWKWDYISTNASKLERFADANLTNAGGGRTFVKSGTYNVDAGWTVGRKNSLIGENMFSTILNVTHAVTAAITISADFATTSYCSYDIENFLVNMNGFAGHGIYAKHAGNNNGRDMTNVRNINVNGTIAGYSSFHLIDVFNMDAENLRSRTYGYGLYLGINETNAKFFGNSHFGNVRVGPLGDNVRGIFIDGGVSYNLVYLTFDLPQVIRVTVGTNVTSMLIRGLQSSTFNMADLEKGNINLDINEYASGKDAYDLTFNNPQILGSGTDGVLLGTKAYETMFYGGRITVTSGNGFRDLSAEGTHPNILYNVENVSGTWTMGTNTKAYNCKGFKTEAYGNATVAAGASSIAVDTNIVTTIAWITVTPTNSTFTGTYYVTKTADTFTIHTSTTGAGVFLYKAGAY